MYVSRIILIHQLSVMDHNLYCVLPYLLIGSDVAAIRGIKSNVGSFGGDTGDSWEYGSRSIHAHI